MSSTNETNSLRTLLDENGRDHGVAALTDVFPRSLNIANLVRSQLGLGISQVLGFPEESSNRSINKFIALD